MNARQKYTTVITLKVSADSPQKLQGELLRLAREAKRLTQEELAVRLNVSRSTVASWERGGLSQEIYNLEEILGVEPRAFYVKDGDLSSPKTQD